MAFSIEVKLLDFPS